MPLFDYDAAFSRNLGWTTDWEQATLRIKRVAIAGMGGVGGAHLLTLSRLGIGQFHIADFDCFEIVNFNRQAGATMASIGRPKVDVLAEMALSINPELQLTRFGTGVTPGNLDQFLTGCDLFVDGLDFFALAIRAQVFARCAELGIPAVTAAPIGMGVGFLAFLPRCMTFEQYFRLRGQTDQEQYLRFLMGITPRGLHRTYLVDDTRVDLAEHRGPSMAAACELCAGVVATQAMKLLLGRGDVPYAPVHLHFDAYRGLAARTRLRWGNDGPIQRLKLAIGRKAFKAMATRSAAVASEHIPNFSSDGTPLLAILNLARWTPSGDNVQPWRFELVDADTVVVHLLGTDTTNPYEYRDGEPILLAGGMLLESIRVAASLHGRSVRWTIEPTGPPWRVRVYLLAVNEMKPNPLASALLMRSVRRGAMGTRPLTTQQKAELQAALGAGLQVSWHEEWTDRLLLARLGSRATDIRLRSHETFVVHEKVIDWQRDRSPDGIPARALGLNRPTLVLMRWAMRHWARIKRINTFVGTGGIALQLDLWPALNCAAFFVVRADVIHQTAANNDRANRVAPLLRTGEQLQRFWLTATRLGFAVQPALATLIFADYGKESIRFTQDEAVLGRAKALAKRAEAFLGPMQPIQFIGRIGVQRNGIPGPRSVRKPLQDLLWEQPDQGTCDKPAVRDN